MGEQNSNSSSDLLEPFVSENRLERIEQVISERKDNLIAVLDHVHNSHNISAVLRSAEAFGIQRVIFVGDSIQHTRGISLGAERWLDCTHFDRSEEALSSLKAESFEIVSLEPPPAPSRSSDKHLRNSPIVTIQELPFERKLALVLGNESEGNSDCFRESADFRAFIPIGGFVESLNVSVAAAICFFCAATSGKGHALDQARQEELRKEWLKQSVSNSEKILEELNRRANSKQG